MRIVSLLPSATEMVCAIGLGRYLVGVGEDEGDLLKILGKENAEYVKGLPRVTRSLIAGGASSRAMDAAVKERSRSVRPLYALDKEMMRRLEPDLVITQTTISGIKNEITSKKKSLANDSGQPSKVGTGGIPSGSNGIPSGGGGVTFGGGGVTSGGGGGGCSVCTVGEGEVDEVVVRIEKEAKKTVRVLGMNPRTLKEVLGNVIELGKMVDVVEADLRARGKADEDLERFRGERRARMLVSELEERIDWVKMKCRDKGRRRVVVLDWVEPIFSCGYWVPELVELAGGQEVLGKKGERAREVSFDELLEAEVDVMVIACCGYDLERAMGDMPLLKDHEGWRKLRCVKRGQVWVVDGSKYLSRPSVGLVESLEMLGRILHREVFSVEQNMAEKRSEEKGVYVVQYQG